MKIKAVIFDLDGTLLDSMHIWRERPCDLKAWKAIEEAYKSEVVLKQGAFELLTSLKSNKIKMVLATATDREFIEPALRRNRMGDFFETIFTCREVGSSKETPLIYHTAQDFLNKLNKSAVPPLNNKEILVFEDAYYAIKTAKRAGFTVAAVYDKWADVFNDKGEISTCDDIKRIADIYIEDYRNFDISSFIR